MSRGVGVVGAAVVGVVISGLLFYVALLILGIAQPLAPAAGEPFFKTGQEFDKGLIPALFLLLFGVPSTYLLLLRGR